MPDSTRTISLTMLDEVRIATPCDASWEAMAGDERKRFCVSCNKHVHNIAGYTREEASRLLSRHGEQGRLCLRLTRGEDGSVVTRGRGPLAGRGPALWRRAGFVVLRPLVVVVLVLVALIALWASWHPSRSRAAGPLLRFAESVRAFFLPPAGGGALKMGKIAPRLTPIMGDYAPPPADPPRVKMGEMGPVSRPPARGVLMGGIPANFVVGDGTPAPVPLAENAKPDQTPGR